MAVSGAIDATWTNTALDYLFTAGTATAPADTWLAITTAEPGDAADMSVALEMDSTGSYTRQDLSSTLQLSSQVVSLSGDITFTQATANWQVDGGDADCSHWAICEASVLDVDDVICYGDMASARTITNADTLVFTGASLAINVAAGTMFNNGQDLLLKWLFGSSTGITEGTRPTAWYLSLWTSSPGDDESGTEVSTSGTAYARVQLTGGTALTVTTDTVSFSGDVSFAEATGAGFGTVTHFGIHSAASGTGNGLCYGTLTSARTIDAGDTFKFLASGSSITLD